MFKIKHFSYRLDLDETHYNINLIFEPLEQHLIDWCIRETNAYKSINIIHDLEGYEKATRNVDHTDIWSDQDKLNDYFKGLDKYHTHGYIHNNSILQRLRPPFDNIYCYNEYFINNKIVIASIETITDLMNRSEPFSQDLIDVIKTLDQHWY